MPAPTPITIRHDRPGMLGRLAAASGSAAYNLNDRYRQEDQANDRYRMEYQGYLQRLAGDRATLSAERDRRSRESQYAAEYGQRSEIASREEDARNRAFELQEAAIRQQVGERRSGSVTAPSRAATPVTFTGIPAADRPSSSSATINGTRYRRNPQTGELEQFTPGTEEDALPGRMAMQPNGAGSWSPAPQGGGVSYAQRPTPGTSPEVQSQMNYLTSIQGRIPADQWNAMWVAAQSGGLTMDQLIDNARMAEPEVIRPSSRQSLMDRSVERYQMDLEQIRRTGGNKNALVSWGRTNLNRTDAVQYDTEDVLQAVQEHIELAEAVTKPVQNSSGRTPSGGNPVRVNSPQEAAQLPSGTYIQLPDGSLGRVP